MTSASRQAAWRQRQHTAGRRARLLYLTDAEYRALTAELARLRGDEGVTSNAGATSEPGGRARQGSGDSVTSNAPPYRFRAGRDGWDYLIEVDGEPVAGLQRFHGGIPQEWDHPEPPRWRAQLLTGSALRPWHYGKTRAEVAERLIDRERIGGS